MPDAPGAALVPLNIWICPDGPQPGVAARRTLADHVLSAYAPKGGTVLDLAPGGGEVLRAAKTLRRSVVALPVADRSCTASRTPRLPHRVGKLIRGGAPIDVAVLLPPAESLAPPYRRFSLSCGAQLAMLSAVAPAVRSGGFVALATLGDPSALTSAGEAADAAGLAYFQHVVALLVPTTRPAVRTHVDVLVFARRTA